MKTNALFTVLLVVMVALAAGCETPGSWQSKIAGTYPGSIFNDPEEYPSTTTFKFDKGKLSGTFELEVDGTTIDGNLREFAVTGERKLKCRWINYEQRAGDFNMTFSPDLSSFKGNWVPDDQNGSGAWNGKKK